MSPFKLIVVLLIIPCLIVGGCSKKQKQKKMVDNEVKTKELIIYCENTMKNIVVDLKDAFEKEYNCRIMIQNDCSKNLMGIIKYSAKGDIYIPSSTHSFNSFQDQTSYQLTDSLFLGYNHLVYMVKKGNPGKFSGITKQLKRKGKYAVIIANPETSSLGFETKKFLDKQRAYNNVLENVVELTSDSKGLAKGVKEDQADVAINWQSNINVNGNKDYIEIINPQAPYNNAVPVYAAVISCSTEPDLARSFLRWTYNELSEAKLSRYGFSKRPNIIF